MANNLTAASIAAMRPAPKRREIPDGKVSGLFLVVQPSGAMSWAVRYRAGGKPRKLTLGPHPVIDLATARGRAMEALAQVTAGGDPAEEKIAARAAAVAAVAAKGTEPAPAARDDVGRVVSEFIERHAKPKTRDWAETQRMLEKDVLPVWRGRRLGEISRSDVHELLDGIIDRGAPVGANRVFAQIRKMCRWALQRGLIDHDPTAGLSAPSPEKSRDRVLTDSEIATVWGGAERLGFPYGPVVKALLLTGQRREEVGGMLWSEIDLDAKVWRLPPERTKNKRAHSVPLSVAMMSLLLSLPRFGSDLVFSSGRTPPSCYSRAKRQIDALISDALDGETLPHWVFHDCRRSVASGMARLGVDMVVVERALNHISGSFGGIVGVYQKHKFETETRAALDAWAKHVEVVTSGSAP